MNIRPCGQSALVGFEPTHTGVKVLCLNHLAKRLRYHQIPTTFNAKTKHNKKFTALSSGSTSSAIPMVKNKNKKIKTSIAVIMFLMRVLLFGF